MKKIYLAASFAFSDKQESERRKQKITDVASVFRAKGFDVFVPHEHTIPNAWGMPNRDWGAAVYGMDTAAINDCDIVVLASWGKSKTSAGALWEAGYAVGIGKPLVVLSLDPDAVESLMVVSSAKATLTSIYDICGYDWENLPTERRANNEVS